MGTFTLTFSDVDGSVTEVKAYHNVKEERPVTNKNIGEMVPTDIDPSVSFQQAVTLDFIHKPGNSICSIVIGGVLYKWC